jgi:hypothetical protein
MTPELTTIDLPSFRADPSLYCDLLLDLIAKHGVDCWLNSGWITASIAPASACRSR